MLYKIEKKTEGISHDKTEIIAGNLSRPAVIDRLNKIAERTQSRIITNTENGLLVLQAGSGELIIYQMQFADQPAEIDPQDDERAKEAQRDREERGNIIYTEETNGHQ